MSTEENKALVRRFYDDIWMKGNLAVADDLVAADYVRHDPRGGAPTPGPEGQKQIAAMFRAAFPDFQSSYDVVLAEADLVAVRWTIRGTHQGEYLGIPPTGRGVGFTGVNIFRIAGGKIVELWNHRDDLGFMQQLGVIPAAAPAPAEATD